MPSTHALWLTLCADKCVAALRGSRVVDWALYQNVAHQMAQARPGELREFVESYPFDKALQIAPLMVLAWRIVGNEYKVEMAGRASDAIAWLCDIDEWERAVEALVEGGDA